jgi:hypothetical protein
VERVEVLIAPIALPLRLISSIFPNDPNSSVQWSDTAGRWITMTYLVIGIADYLWLERTRFRRSKSL